MARPRGYSGYRGRGGKGKLVLAAFLVLVILAAVVVMLLQRNIVYDAQGTPQLRLPWTDTTEEEATQEQETPDVDLIIQESEEPEPVLESHVIFQTEQMPLTLESWQAVLQQIDQDAAVPYDAVAFTLKDSSGKVYFDALAMGVSAVNVEEDTMAALAEATAGNLYTIARMSCFRDPKAANADVEGKGLKNTGGYIFYDGNNSQWLDPAKEAARTYLCGIAVEAAELGFDEILLTDFSYPTEGKLDKIAYGDVVRSEQLLLFLQEVCAALEPYGVKISVELSQEAVLSGGDEVAGVVVSELAELVDRIYAPATAAETEMMAAETGDALFVPILTAYEDMPEHGGLIG